jgi:hypothetical protein
MYSTVNRIFHISIRVYIIIIIIIIIRAEVAHCTSPRWQMMVIVGQLVDWRLAGETEVLGYDQLQT